MRRRRLFSWSVSIIVFGLTLMIGGGVYSVLYETFGAIILILSAFLYSGTVAALAYIAVREGQIKRVELALQFGCVMLGIPMVILFVVNRPSTFQQMAEGGAVLFVVGIIGALASFLWTRLEVQLRRPK